MTHSPYNKGVSLTITVFIVIVVFAMVMALVTIIINQFKISNTNDYSLSAVHAADSGIEKTLFFDRTQIPVGAVRGLCSICTSCPDCTGCTLTPLAAGGCDANQCNNCRADYNSAFDGRQFFVRATVNGTQLIIDSQGTYNNASRTSHYDSTQP